jgi:hypothetical protein
MHFLIQKSILGSAMLLAIAAFLSPVLQAQEDGPPNVLVITREYLKPGKGGMQHDRSEAAFVRGFSAGEPNAHYFAMDSLSGSSRALFLSAYDSFDDWENETKAIGANKTKTAAIDHAAQMDGDLLSGYDTSVMMLRPDLSLNKGHIKGTRYFEFITFLVKPGHIHEFTQLAHMYAETYRKVDPQTHWDCFEVMYGNPAPGLPSGDTFIVVITRESLDEIDKGVKDGVKFAAELGDKGMAKVEELTAASVEAEGSSLFQINPRTSNPPAEWVKQDQGFWKGPASSTEKGSSK